jgi:hypothetical protein
MFELSFLKVGIDPDLVGGFLEKPIHKVIHRGSKVVKLKWGRGGPWNFQFQKFVKEGAEFTNGDRVLKFVENDPTASAAALDEFVKLLYKRVEDAYRSGTAIDWPFWADPK